MSRSKTSAAKRGRADRDAKKPPARRQAGADSRRAAGARRATVLPALGAMALAAIAYWRSLRTPFVYDDHLTVTGNPSLVDPGNFGAILRHFRFRPVVNVSYALDRAIWGPDPFGFHLTNLLLHLLNTLLVFAVARRVFDDSMAHDESRAALRREPSGVFAVVVAGLFAVHPMLYQAVGYVSARSELLVATFVLGALLAFRRWIDSSSALAIGAALALFAAGLASKETAAAWPLLALAWDLLLHPRSDEQRRRRLLRFHAPLLAIVALGGAVRLFSFFQAEADLPRPFAANLLSQLPIFWRYVRLLAFPVGQSVVHAAQTATGIASPAVLLSLFALIATAVAAWRWRRRAPVVVLGWIWLVAAIAPSSVVPLNELMAEHRVSLASVGFFMIVAAAAIELYHRFPTAGARRLQAVGLAAVLVLLIGLTWRRAAVWSDEVTLWTEATERAPKTWAAHFFQGEALRLRDGCAASLDAYRRSITFLPEDEVAHLRIGVCLADTGDAAAARTEFETALALEPKSTYALDYLGRIAGNENHFDQARDYFERSVAADPNNVTALLDLAKLHESVLDQPAEALRLCRDALARGEVHGRAEACVHRNEAALARRGKTE